MRAGGTAAGISDRREKAGRSGKAGTRTRRPVLRRPSSRRRPQAAGRDRAVSDAERQAAVTRLKRACGEGLLDLAEYSERLNEAELVRTRAEPTPLIDDIPTRAPVAGRGADAGETRAAPQVRAEWHVSPVGGLRRHGRRRMDRHLVSPP